MENKNKTTEELLKKLVNTFNLKELSEPDFRKAISVRNKQNYNNYTYKPKKAS